jgi:hypothetical protein
MIREELVSDHAGRQFKQSETKKIAESLVEDFRRLAAKAEELRRVPDESIELLKSSGLLRVLQPAS